MESPDSRVWTHQSPKIASCTEKNKRAIWLSVTQLSMELHFGATLYEEKKWLSPTKESWFSKLLSKRAILALFFFSVWVVLYLVSDLGIDDVSQ